MKRKLYLLAAPLLLAGSAQAATVVSLDFVNMDPSINNAAVTDGVNSGLISRATDNSGLPLLTTFTTNDLDLNGDGVSDTFSFLLTVAGTTGGDGTAANVGTRGGSPNNGWEVTSSSAVKVGDTLNFSVSGATVILGVGVGSTSFMPSIDFDGFSSVGILFGSAGERYSIDGGAPALVETTPFAAPLADLQSFTFASEPETGASATSLRVNDLDMGFTFTTTVPEPSSTALLGLGGLALILRRRK